MSLLPGAGHEQNREAHMRCPSGDRGETRQEGQEQFQQVGVQTLHQQELQRDLAVLRPNGAQPTAGSKLIKVFKLKQDVFKQAFKPTLVDGYPKRIGYENIATVTFVI